MVEVLARGVQPLLHGVGVPSFSRESDRKLDTCVPELQHLFRKVVVGWDCTVLEGARSFEQQRRNFDRGVSRTLRSKHLLTPSEAVDVAPYPLKWPQKPNYSDPEDVKRWMKEYGVFYFFGGYVLGMAHEMGIPIIYGGDWDRDRDIHDQDFDDLVHFELIT